MKKLIEHHCTGNDGTSKLRNIPPQGVSTAKSVDAVGKAKLLDHDSLSCGQEETGHEWLQAAECRNTETVDTEQEYKKKLHHFLTVEYGLSVKEMFPAARGFLLNGDQLYLVDWDFCLLAPIERDAWIFISDRDELEKINATLAKNRINYRLEQNRLCYYCYQFFFHYLNEFLKSIFDAKSERQKAEIAESLIAYLKDCWIYQQLQAADAISCTAK